MELDGRERYLVAVTLFEWIEKEQEKQSARQRTSECEDLQGLLEREFPQELIMIKDARKLFEGAHREEKLKNPIKGYLKE